VEERTDRGAEPSWEHIGTDACERLVGLVTPLVDEIINQRGFALDNPMGLKPLVAG
jgi:hypothetical protein